ncbi:hypothetical protein IWX65_002639 [Arthrobacter sp. CAN_A214]
MYHQSVAFTNKYQQVLEFWAFRIFSGGLVGEHPVQLDAFQLTLGVLIQAADPDIPNTLTGHGASYGEVSG